MNFCRLITKIVLLLTIILCINANAQDNLSRNTLMLTNVNTSDGLSSARVYSIIEADDGAMWISTKRGVDRYNGQQVKNYTLSTGMTYSDASGQAVKLATDNKHRIFAYDNKGKVYIYNKEKDIFQLQVDMKKMLGTFVMLNDLQADDNGCFWMALDKGVYRLNVDGRGHFILKNTFVSHLQFIAGQLLIGSPSGVYVCHGEDAKPKLVTKKYSVLSSYYDKANHKVWLGTFHSGVIVMDDRTWQQAPTLPQVPLIPVRDIIPYGNNSILMAVDGAGVYAYDRKERCTELLLNTDGRQENALHGNGIYTLCKDRKGNLWIGSYTGGVDLAIPIEHSLKFVRNEYLNSQSLVNNGVNDILQSPGTEQHLAGKIWFATDKGVSIYDERTKLWTHALRNKVVLSLCQTADGNVLVGTYGDGVYKVKADGSSESVYTVANGKLKTDYVYSVFRDSGGCLWIGCLDGDLILIDTTTDSSKGAISLPINEVQSIVESPDRKNVTVGTTHGCYLIDKRTHGIKRFFYNKEFPKNDYNFFVNAMTYQDADNIWIGTDGGGLYLYDLRHHKVRNYTINESVPSNTVCALVRTTDGKLWMSTDKGLAYIDNGKVTSLNFFKGLEREYRRMAVEQTADGRMIFGSNDGAVVLSPRFARGLDYSASLHITGADVEGKTFGETSESEEWNASLYNMIQKGKMHMAHDENTITVHFESINYQYQHDIRYQYFLEGYDHQWSEPSSAQQARFANLPPGNYTLHIKAIGRSNGRILGEESLEINIAQPWWNSWWAWIIYLCILVSIAYVGWDYYRERLHRKYYDEKINFFVNTAHNIRTPLSLVLAPLADLAKDGELSQKNRQFLDMAQRNGDKLLRMVSELLDFQKVDQSDGKVHLQQVALPTLMQQQVDKFQVYSNEKSINLSMQNVAEVSLQTDLSMIDLIFENLISNAVKYTPKGGNVTLSAHKNASDREVEIKVSDTGIGIPKAESKQIFKSFFRASNAVQSEEMGSGIGLMLTRQLTRKLGGKLTFDSEEDKGTTFTITFPCQELTDDTVSDMPVTKIDNGDDKRDTILFVDDNMDLRQYIRMAFSDKYHVIDVDCGEAALRYLEKEGLCDIVISDVMMPGMQGVELCRRIKENEDTSWLPVILLTAKAGRDFMIEGLGLGADDYIAKPFDSAILASKIDSMLRNRRRLSKYYMNRSMAVVRQELESEEADEETAQETSAEDRAFIEKATRLVMDNLQDTDFNIDCLCREMAMSRTLFYGKLKTLTGQTPSDFIRLIRLEQAAIYLKHGDAVLDVSVKTGFVNVKYFSTVFKKHFGVSPSKYA